MTDSSILTADPKNTAKKLETFRSIRPLVHCITNEVVQEITANVLLAAGASPAMVVGEGETEQFASIANAVSVNVGTPYENRVAIMKKAARAASEAGRPWVLDPVAAGGMPWRDKIIFELLELGPAAVRGNASEIRFLAGVGTGGKGVDSLDSSEQAVEAAKTLAKKYKTLVVVTGETDYATDGERVLAARGGNPMITLVVGTGCSLSSLLAGFIGANGASVETCIACCDYVNRAGELAAARAKGPGSFHCEYLDALWLLQPGDFKMKKKFDLSLYLVLDANLCMTPDGMVETTRKAIDGGCTIVQLRAPEWKKKKVLEAARKLKALLEPEGIPLIINDHIDVALLSKADGLHVGQDDISPTDARALLGNKAVIGLSIGSGEEMREADPEADYFGIGPVYATQTKKDAGAAVGIEGLKELCAMTEKPCVAIGGINRSNAFKCVEAGADGVAVVSAICGADDPEAAAAAILQEADLAKRS